MQKKTLLIIFIISFFISHIDGANYKFRLYLTDKGTSSYSIDKPIEFLSQKSINRRLTQNIAIEATDLPISEEYIKKIENLGCTVVTKSKWLNTVSVQCSDYETIEEIKKLDFVKDAILVWESKEEPYTTTKSSTIKSTSIDADYYGAAKTQIAIHKGEALHGAGFNGEGIDIAVIDGGFQNIEENLLLSNINIKEIKDFVYEGSNVPQSAHGTYVVSCMAGNVPNTYVGTAPKAKYWLLRSEDPSSEFPIEEDYWIAAAEYADSVGVDIINTSLGYTNFDAPTKSYTYEQMDGKTAHITQGAEFAVSKGIFVVSSAGNEGNKTWRYISAPGDGENVFTVGAINSSLALANFSSRGPTYDGRTKPNVVAMGEKTSLIHPNGNIIQNNGTSFSAPVMAGLVASFWQAFPSLTNKQVARILESSADRNNNPDNDYGYGIPNMEIAMELGYKISGIENNTNNSPKLFLIKKDNEGNIIVEKTENNNSKYAIRIFSIDGKAIISDILSSKQKTYDIKGQKGKVYIIHISGSDFSKVEKVIL